MANFMDLFNPSPRNEQANPEETQSQWDSWLQNDKNRSALLQFGINLMQPFAPGQTGIGHFGQALGAAGEAMGRIDEQDFAKKMQEEELSGKKEDRELRREDAEGRREDRRQGRELTEQRIATAAGQLELARDRLANDKEKEQARRIRQSQIDEWKKDSDFVKFYTQKAKNMASQAANNVNNIGKDISMEDWTNNPSWVAQQREEYLRGVKATGAPPVEENKVTSSGLTSGTKPGKPMSDVYFNQPIIAPDGRNMGMTPAQFLSEKIHPAFISDDPKQKEWAFTMLNALKREIGDPGAVDKIVAGWKVKPNG